MLIDHIYYINARFKHKGKEYYLQEIVYKHNAEQLYSRSRILKKYKVYTPVILFNIEIIKQLGKSII